MFSLNYSQLYRRFDAPIAACDCGENCAPYNELGAPFCCDIRHAVPSAYESEWHFLFANTTLWKEYRPENQSWNAELHRQLPEGQVLLECLGHRLCQRDFRSIVCRTFPFFPYVTRQGEFIGLSYYWEYEDRCWVASNLQVVTQEYRSQFMDAYDEIFHQNLEELNNFREYSIHMRRVFGRRHRAIPLLHRNGFFYKVTPANGRVRRVQPQAFPKFGPYKIAVELPFLDEIT
jgi:hypothetical protein